MTPSEIKERRIALGYSIRGFAALLKCNKSTIVRWESGATTPEPMELLECAFKWYEHLKSQEKKKPRNKA